MSARDIAVLARRLIADFPEYYRYDAEKSFKFNNIEQENRNTLVQKGIADGLKTGHTDDGGYGMVVSAQRQGRRTIVVVNGLETMRARRGERAAAGVDVPRVRGRDAVHRRRHDRAGAGVAGDGGERAAGGRTRRGGDDAAGLAQPREDHGGIHEADPGAGDARDDAGAACGDRGRGAGPEPAAAGRRRRAAAGPAGAGDGRADAHGVRQLTPGRFITLEGGEGGGKSTQARLLAEALALRGLPVLRTREPGGAPGAELLRDLLLNGPVAWSPPAEAMLHFAARAEHAARTIRPALAAGIWVVCDRFADSTMVYQGYGQDADRGMIAALAGLLGLVPDLTLVLDVPVEVSVARLAGRGGGADRYESLGEGFFARVRGGGFRAVAAGAPERCVVVDGGGGGGGGGFRVLAAVDVG